MTEQRKSSRKIFRTATTVSMATGQTHAARSYDLGVGGMCVITTVRLEVGSQCTVAFDVPPAVGGNLRIAAQARIVYSLPCSEGFKNGLQFFGLGAAETAALHRHLAAAH